MSKKSLFISLEVIEFFVSNMEKSSTFLSLRWEVSLIKYRKIVKMRVEPAS
jgi:hypothetical protein